MTNAGRFNSPINNSVVNLGSTIKFIKKNLSVHLDFFQILYYNKEKR